MPATLEKLSRSAEPKNPFSDAALAKDIIENIRPFSSNWPKIEKGVTTKQKNDNLWAYIKEIQESEAIMVEAAQKKSQARLDVLRIRALYGAEMVGAWHSRLFLGNSQKDKTGVLMTVEWQNRVAEYIFQVQRDYPNVEQQDKVMRHFWSSYSKIMNSVSPSGSNEKTHELAAIYKNGILLPVALGYALEHRNGWQVRTPLDVEDDAFLKVDLIARSNEGNYLLIQVKSRTEDERGEELDFDFEPIMPNTQKSYSDYQIDQFRIGVDKFIKKYHVDPNKVLGVFVSISNYKIDGTTGTPEARLSGTIQQTFDNLNASIERKKREVDK